MSPDQQAELDAVIVRLTRAAERAEAAAKQYELSAQVALKTVSGHAFAAMIEQQVGHAVLKSLSPWVARSEAHLWWPTSATGIDNAVAMGVFKRRFIGTNVVFVKEEVDAAINEGRWVPYDKAKIEDQGLKMAREQAA